MMERARSEEGGAEGGGEAADAGEGGDSDGDGEEDEEELAAGGAHLAGGDAWRRSGRRGAMARRSSRTASGRLGRRRR